MHRIAVSRRNCQKSRQRKIQGQPGCIFRAEQLEGRHLLAVITVDSLLDNFDPSAPATDGMVTLREAILAANMDTVVGDAPAGNGADEIQFAPSLFTSGPQTLDVARTYSVAFDPTAFEILDDLTITGPDAGLLTIDVSDLDPTPDSTLDDGVIDNDGDGARVFLVAANVTMSGMTLTGGDVYRYGGAILSGGNLTLTNMSITGNIAGTTGGGIVIPIGDLTINNSTISNNASSDMGGGIALDTFPGYSSSMTVADSVISGNRGADGGGIAALRANLTIVRSTITDNTAGASAAVGSHGDGGGIFAGSSDLTILDSTISSNSSVGQGGGGLALVGNTALIEDSQIVGNQAISTSPNLGGGIEIGGGDLTVRRSNISGNTVSNSYPNPYANPNYFAAGGGIAAKSISTSLSVTVIESTISGNVAYLGGGIASFYSSYSSANLSIVDSTLSGNSATYGGGVYSKSSTSEVTTVLSNSTVSGNSGLGAVINLNRALIEYSTITNNQSGVYTAGLGGSYTEVASSIIAGNSNADVAGSLFQSNGYNLIGTGETAAFTNNDQIEIHDPMLGPLQDNGGPTETHAPQTGSLAVDAGDPNASAGVGRVPEHDQRGMSFGRVEGGTSQTARIDIGAFEVQPKTTLDCDFDGLNGCDLEDIDALIMEIVSGTNNALYDLTGDMLVNLADRDRWLQDAGAMNLASGNAYLLGDSNLDGIVDGLDFIIWNSNKFTFTGKWSQADWNADGVTEGQDFILWNGNKFQSSDIRGTVVIASRRESIRPLSTRPVESVFAISDTDEYLDNLLSRTLMDNGQRP